MAPPSTIVVAAPPPLIVTLSVTSRSPVAAASSPAPAIVSVYVPAGSVMTSAPALPFAATIASRSEQSASQLPSLVSAIFVTRKVAAFANAAIEYREKPRVSTAMARRDELGNLIGHLAVWGKQ